MKDPEGNPHGKLNHELYRGELSESPLVCCSHDGELGGRRGRSSDGCNEDLFEAGRTQGHRALQVLFDGLHPQCDDQPTAHESETKSG